MTEDTYRGETDEPDTQNLYAYCAGNPVNYVDPSGHKYKKYELVFKLYKLALKPRSKGVHLYKIKSINRLFHYRLKHSKTFKSKMKSKISNFKKSKKKEKWYDDGLNFTSGKNSNSSDKDLHLAVGHSVTIWKLYKKNNKIKVRVHIADRYDFSKFSKKMHH